MKAYLHIAAVLAVASASGLSTAAFAQGSTCNARHAVCLQSGRDETACLSAWHQCKAASLRAAVSHPVAAKPTPMIKVAAAARR